LLTRRASSVTAGMCGWWVRRWVVGRLRRAETLGRLRRHTLVHPMHGARVVLPREDFEQPVFEEWVE